MTCPDGKKFSLEKYGKAQGEGTTWIITRAKPMWDFLERMDLPKKKGKRKDRKLMVKSYLLQEAEAVSREAKIRWAKEKGLRVMNLQHDGLVIQTGVENIKDYETQMEKAAEEACGYKVQIKGKGY